MDIFSLGTASFFYSLNPIYALFHYATGSDWPDEPALPQGDGRPVLVFPGFGASGAATAYLRTKLEQLHYEVYDWECGINIGPVGNFDAWLSLLSEQLHQIYARHGRQITIIGWSLGGSYAHALRNKHPDLVLQVVTLGTPFECSLDVPDLAKHDSVPHAMEGTVKLSKATDPYQAKRSLSVYSRNDGVVDWEKCIRPEVSGHSNIEATGVDHFGMIYHPKVFRIIADFLLVGAVRQDESIMAESEISQ